MAEDRRHPTESRLTADLYRYLGGVAFGLLMLGTIMYRILEDWSWVDSLYFSTVAVTTVALCGLRGPCTLHGRIQALHRLLHPFRHLGHRNLPQRPPQTTQPTAHHTAAELTPFPDLSGPDRSAARHRSQARLHWGAADLCGHLPET